MSRNPEAHLRRRISGIANANLKRTLKTMFAEQHWVGGDSFSSAGTGSFSILLNMGAPSKFYGQAERAISTGKLHALLHLHIQPIKQVIFLCPSFPLRVGRSHLEECFPLICIQRLSQPNFATQPCRWHDSWNTRGSSIPVLSY